jgi:hypothetical protein
MIQKIKTFLKWGLLYLVFICPALGFYFCYLAIRKFYWSFFLCVGIGTLFFDITFLTVLSSLIVILSIAFFTGYILGIAYLLTATKIGEISLKI